MADTATSGFAEAFTRFAHRTVDAPLDSRTIDSPIVKSRMRHGVATLTIWDAKDKRHRLLTGTVVPTARDDEALRFVFDPSRKKFTVKDRRGKIHSFDLVADAPNADGLRTA